MRTKRRAATIDEYLATLSADAAIPRAEECISYRIPAFRLDGKVLVWFGAAFQPTRPLPAALVRRLVKARIARNPGRERCAAKSVGRRG